MVEWREGKAEGWTDGLMDRSKDFWLERQKMCGSVVE